MSKAFIAGLDAVGPMAAGEITEIKFRIFPAQARVLAGLVKRLDQQARDDMAEPGTAEVLSLLQRALEIAGFIGD
jgi:hypothetical protein